MVDYQAAISVIRQTLDEVRPKLLHAYGSISYSSKSDGSPVTELDIEVEKLLRKRLIAIAPGTGFHAEETAHETLAKTSWLVDPIDGTGAFIRGLPMCSNLVALMEDGQVSLGVVNNFVNGEFFHAIRNQGAYLNGKKIGVSNRPLGESVVTFESSTDYQNDFSYAKRLTKVMPTGVTQRILWGYDAALVAQGKAEGIICLTPYEHIWDVAPGSLLIEEAGGIVRNLNSNSYNPENMNFIASTKIVYEALHSANIV